MKIKMFMFAALAAFATLAGCSDDDNGGGTVIPPEEKPSEYEVTFTTTSYYSTVATIKSKTDNAKWRYYMASFWESAYLKEKIKGTTANEIAKGIIRDYQMNYPTASMADIINELTIGYQLNGLTPKSIPLSGLTPGTEYSLVVAGVDSEGNIVANGIVAKVTTETLPDFEAQNCTFDWSFSDTKQMSVTMKFVPSAKDVPYFSYIMSKADYASMFGSNPAKLKELMPSYIAKLSTAAESSVTEFVKKMQMKDDTDFQITGLTPGTDYIVFVCGMDDFGRATTNVSVKEVRTNKYEASDAITKSVKVELFDGTLASEINPAMYPPDTFSGGYLLRFSPEFSENCSKNWYILVTTTNYSGLADNELLIKIMSGGNLTNQNPVGVPRVQQNITAYAYIFAQTEDGEPGNIFRCPGFVTSAANLSGMDILFPDLDSAKGATSVALSSVNEMKPETVGNKKVVRAL